MRLRRIVQRLVAVLAVSAAAVGGLVAATPAEPAGAVVNGTQAAQGEYPAVAGILQYVGGGGNIQSGGYNVACTGTLVHPNYVLTAAHCLTTQASNLAVMVGRANLNDTSHGSVRFPSTYYIHPSWDPSTNAYDVALLYFSNPITDITPMRLVEPTESSYWTSGKPAVAAGYGRNCQTCNSSPQLNKLAMTVRSDSDARALYSYVNSDVQVGASAAGGTGICFGDSGGPLFVRVGADGALRQIGIASRFTGNCTDGQPVLYSRVVNQWIKRFIHIYAPQEQLSGYVWDGSPTTGSFTPSAYSSNSSGARNTITRLNVGVYRLEFPNLDADDWENEGIAHATAYNTANMCKPAFWYSSGASEFVNVNCFTPAGQAADTQFTASFTRNVARQGWGQNSWALGYLVDTNPYASTFTPAGYQQFNSANASTDSVTRNGVGNYQVNLGVPGGSDGTVDVSANGTDANTCKAGGWGNSNGHEVANVRCFNPAGQPTDAVFGVTYHRNTNLLAKQAQYAYMWASNPTTPSYTPSTGYQGHSTYGATSTVDRLGVGWYRANVPYVGGTWGNVQVTAYGSGPERCNVAGWGPASNSGNPPTMSVYVQCFNGASPVDTYFDLDLVF